MPADPAPPVAARRSALASALRVPAFLAGREEILSLGRAELGVGLAATWLVGIGRWWDDPRAPWLQKTGLGSVAYVFVLATFLWLLLLPLRPERLTWRNVLTFVTLTAPPAAIYALPVERWMDVRAAMSVNLWFLAGVASWRLALLVVYLVRVLRLGWLTSASVLALPAIGIVWALVAINPERAIPALLDVMGGVRDRPPPTPGDAAYQLLQGIACAGALFALPAALVYSIRAEQAVRRRRAERRAAGAAGTP